MNIREVNRQLIEDFRANNGQVGGMFAGMKLVLVTTVGAKSGEPRTAPLGYQVHDGDVVVIASNMGAAKHPAWFTNLVANSAVTVELPGETYEAIAVVPSGAERDAWFSRVAEVQPFFHEHQAQTSRPIPVVVLKRR